MLPDNVRPEQDFRTAGVMTPIQMQNNVPIEDSRVTLMSLIQTMDAPVIEYAKDRAAKAKMLAASLADPLASPTLLVFWPGNKSTDVFALSGQADVENCLRRLGYRPRSEIQVQVGGEEWLSDRQVGNGVATLTEESKVGYSWPNTIEIDTGRIR